MLHTNFSLLKLAGACGQKRGCNEGYDKLATHLGGTRKYGKNKPIPLIAILDNNGLDDALWCLFAVPPEEEAQRDRKARLLACDYAERALMRERAAGREPDPRSWKAIEVSRAFAVGKATLEQLAAAGAAAGAAERAGAWAAEREWQAQRFREMLGE